MAVILIVFRFHLYKGFHQKCHNPAIEDKALEPEEPWMCTYCTSETECPYLLNPFETKLQKELNSIPIRNSTRDSKVGRKNDICDHFVFV